MKHLVIALVICSGSLSASSAHMQPDSISVDSVSSVSLSPAPTSSGRCGIFLGVSAALGVSSAILLAYAYSCTGFVCGAVPELFAIGFAAGGIVFLLIGGVCYALGGSTSKTAPQ